MRISNDLPCRAARLTFTILMTLAWAGWAQTPGPASPAAGGAAGASGGAEREGVAALDRLLAAVEAAQRKIPRESFDAQAVIDAVGKSPEKLFEWVRDNTHWVAYAGALRGPVGLLMDRAGNSLDRSLLLAELLRRAGQNVRLARAMLPAAQAKELLGKVRPAPLATRPADMSADEQNAAIAQLCKSHQLDEAKLRETTDASAKLAGAILKDAADRVAAQSELVLKAMGAVPPVDDAAATAAEAAALADHWWVQYQEKGKWVDLDPLLADAKVGESKAVAKETIPIRVADGKVHLDARFCQEVEVRVVVERRQGGKLIEEVVLKHALRPADVIGERITLLHVPLQWPRKLDLSKEADPAARLKAELPKLVEWTPVLAVGKRAIKGKTIRVTGDTKNTPGGGMVPGGFSPGGGFGGALGGGGGGAPKESGEFTAQWIDYVIRVPGQPPRTVRREGFDLLGPVARASGQVAQARRVVEGAEYPGLYLLDQTEIVVHAGRFSPQYVSHLMLGGMVRQGAKLRSAAATADPALRERQAVQVAEQLFGISPILLTVAISRFALEDASAVYLASPNVLCYRKGINFGAKGQAVYEGVIDLAVNEVAVLPRARAESFRIRLRQGVADTVAEGIPPAEVQPYGNVSRLFEWAVGQGVGPVVVREAGDALLKDAGLPAVAAARIREALSGGYALVAPQRAVGAGDDARTGWWRVNPRSGDTVGVMDTGFNQATLDNMLIVTEVDLPAVGITVTTPAVAGGVNVQLVAGLLGSYCGAWAGLGMFAMYSLYKEKEQHKADVEHLQQVIKANRESYERAQKSGRQDGSRGKSK